jgi:hypothetical protein
MNQKIAHFINQKIKFDEIYCLPHFYPELDRFDEFQAGYKYNGITGEESKTFNENCYVICSNYFKDPFFVDFSEAEKDYPVYFSFSGTGNWTAIKIAENINEFLEKLQKINVVKKSKYLTIKYLEENFDLENEFWKEIYEGIEYNPTRLIFKNEPDLMVEKQRSISIKQVETELGEDIHQDLLAFWNSYGEISFDQCLIYDFDHIKERNETYQILIYAPDYIMIGDDGGGQGLFIKRDDKTLNLYYLDTGAVGSVAMNSLNINFFEWLQESAEIQEEDDDIDSITGKFIITDIGINKSKVILYLKEILKISGQEALILSKQAEIIIDTGYKFQHNIMQKTKILQNLGATIEFRPD